MVLRRKNAPKGKKPAPRKGVTIVDRREQFFHEYLVDRNASQAAIRAGYSPVSAPTTGYRLLKDAEISARIAEHDAQLARKLTERYEITSDRITRELAILGFSNLADYGRVDRHGSFAVDLRDTPREAMGALQAIKTKRTFRTVGDVETEEVQTEIRLASKREALVDLGKITGLFADGPDLTVPVSFTIIYAKRGEKVDPA